MVCSPHHIWQRKESIHLPNKQKCRCFLSNIKEHRQNFGQVRNSYIRIYDAKTNTEIARYDLDEDFSIETAVEFGRLYRHNGEWKFEAIGNGNKGGLQALVNKYAKQFA